jgi:hypothetical protein
MEEGRMKGIDWIQNTMNFSSDQKRGRVPEIKSI